MISLCILLLSCDLAVYGHQVVLITGDQNDGTRTAEIFDPDSGASCSLPNLMDERAFHTQDGPLTCGGESRPDPGNDDHITKHKTCFIWMSGAWTLSHSLVHARTGHVSFTTSQGTFLMGGEGFRNDKTSELLKHDGSVEPGFELKHRTQ